MRKAHFPAVLALATLLATSSIATADSYRCGRKLIRTGDSSAQVLRVCGEPRAKDRGRADVRDGGAIRNVPVERWHYKQSSRSLSRIVNIHRGRVVSIEVGGR